MTGSLQQITRVAAYGIIKQNEQVLLCRLSNRVTGSEGKWTLPGGGIDFAEAPAQAMVREIMEETGLSAEALDVAAVDSGVFEFEEGIRHSIRIIYHTTHVAGELVFEQGGSTDKCQWFSETEARGLPKVELAKVGLELAYPQG